MTSKFVFRSLLRRPVHIWSLRDVRCTEWEDTNKRNKVTVISRSIHHFDDARGKNKNINFAKIGAAAALSFGAFILTKKKFSVEGLYAAETEEKGAVGGSSRRNTYNFVADVVEMSGSAVVFIQRVASVPFMSRKCIPISHGSGFIIESQGVIITNAHVVGNQSRLKVRLQDGREFEGHVLGVDEGLDLAAVQIPAKNLPYLPLGCSSDIRPGEWVVAMGSPLNLTNTVTAGIVSNIQRAGKELGLSQTKGNMEYIQTDAMINVGNSGGPLINLDGEVIGVNSMMASAGIGFAIPVDYVKDFHFRLKKAVSERRKSSSSDTFVSSGRRRYLGITMLTLTKDIVDQLRLRDHEFPNVEHGVLVHSVQSSSPAERAGMQDGDIIIKINGKDVYYTQDIFQALTASSSIEFTVLRADKPINLRVTPEDVF